ncbi:MAG: hypothetical protein AAF975_07610, partial [Spirochaetota bacterium]
VLSHVKYPKNSFIEVSFLKLYSNETIKFVCEIVGYTHLRNNEIDAVILQNRIEKIAHYDQNLIAAFVYDFENEHEKVKQLLERKNESTATFDSKSAVFLQNRS